MRNTDRPNKDSCARIVGKKEKRGNSTVTHAETIETKIYAGIERR